MNRVVVVRAVKYVFTCLGTDQFYYFQAPNQYSPRGLGGAKRGVIVGAHDHLVKRNEGSGGCRGGAEKFHNFGIKTSNFSLNFILFSLFTDM